MLGRGKRSRGATTTGKVGGPGVVGEIILRHDLERLFKNLPELDRLVVGGQEVVGRVLPTAPLDLVDLLFNLERFEIIKFGLVRLELGVEFVLASLFLDGEIQLGEGLGRADSEKGGTNRLVAFEEDNPTTFIARS